jgi:serine/threonine protein kinase
MISRTISHYQILKTLGSGGIGHVYAACDTELERMVAIKVLRPELANDRSFLDRFRAEATSLARLSHPNITTLYTLHREGKELFMVIELVLGRTIEEIMQQAGRLNLREALAITSQMVAGLSYAHRTGIIHRDIKPSNVMLLETGQLKIMDFGIARVRGSQRMTRQGHIVGTLAYLAPEQVRGAEGDERSDLYSLAIMLYEILSGAPPFAAESDYELARAHVEQMPVPLIQRVPNLPPEIDRVLMQALAKQPEERFASVEAFARALGAPANPVEAADILREGLLARIPPTPADDETRVVEFDDTRPPARPSIVSRVTSFLGEPDRRPFLVLGGTVTAILIGLGLFLATPVPHPPVRGDSANGSDVQKIVKATTNPAEDKTAIGQQASLEVPKAAPEVPKPAPDIPKPAPIRLPDPGPKPDYSLPKGPRPDVVGVIGNVLDSNALVVNGFGPINLYGITDPSRSQDQILKVQQAMKQVLATYGNYVSCFSQSDKTYECYAQDQDIAELAVKNGIARARPDAPAKYRDAEREAQAAHRGFWAGHS